MRSPFCFSGRRHLAHGNRLTRRTSRSLSHLKTEGFWAIDPTPTDGTVDANRGSPQTCPVRPLDGSLGGCQYPDPTSEADGGSLATWGPMTSACLRKLGPAVMHGEPGFASAPHFRQGTHPVHLMGSPSLSRPPIARNEVIRYRTIQPVVHRLRRNVLGLGPDSPWDD